MLLKMLKKVNAIDTSAFVLKIQCNTDKSVLENKTDGTSKKIPYTSRLLAIMLKSLKVKLNYLVEMG